MCIENGLEVKAKRTHSNQICDLAEIRFPRLQQFEEDTDSDNGASLKEEA